MLTFTQRQFFALFFLFIEINVAIVFKKILAIFVIKVRNFVVLITLDNLRSNKDNLNIKFCNCNNKEEVFLKDFKFLLFFFLLCLL